MGSLFFEAITFRDYPVIMGLTLMFSVFTLLGQLLAEERTVSLLRMRRSVDEAFRVEGMVGRDHERAESAEGRDDGR